VLDRHATRYYRLLDDALGRVLQHLKPDDMLFVASDHGFVGARNWFYINEYLARRNMLQRGPATTNLKSRMFHVARETAQRTHLLGAARKVRKAFSNLDDTPIAEKQQSFYKPLFEHIDWTTNHACVLSQTAFGSGVADVFLSPNASPAEREELRLALEAERHPVTGQPLAQAVYATDIYGIGPFRPAEEHIVLLPSTGVTFHLEMGRRRLWEHFEEPKGIHEKEGVFFARGNGIRQGAHLDPLQIYDLVPTVLSALGVSSDEPFDGRVAREIFAARDTSQQDAAEQDEGESLVSRKLKRLQTSKSLLS
jgi:hypothetical protein